MRVLALAKELGVSYNRILAWASRSNLPYSHADDEINGADEKRIRQAFSPQRLTRPPKGDEPSVDDLLSEMVDPSFFPDDFDLPENLEELETIEKKVMRSLPERKVQKPRPERTRTRDILTRYGISGKSILKRLRKLLPEHIARLLNQQDLAETQAAQLKEEIENRAAFHCDSAYCVRTAEKRHSPEILIPVRDAAHCSVCSGSPTRRALEEAAEACRGAGIRRLLLVGGMPASRPEMKNLSPTGIEFRLIEGDLDRPRQRVQADLRWCDLAVIWGSTPLGHSLSGSYLRRKSAGGPFILRINRRSVEALCQEIVKHLDGRTSK